MNWEMKSEIWVGKNEWDFQRRGGNEDYLIDKIVLCEDWIYQSDRYFVEVYIRRGLMVNADKSKMVLGWEEGLMCAVNGDGRELEQCQN